MNGHDFRKMFSEKLIRVVMEDFFNRIIDKNKAPLRVQYVNDAGRDVDDSVEPGLQLVALATRLIEFG